jgi:hypothetical protein
MDWRIFGLIAMVMELCAEPAEGMEPGEPGRGRSPASVIRVLATLRQFLRLGTPWRELTATPERVSGATLRRLAEGDRRGLLSQVQAVLVAMLRGNPVLLIDRCSVRAKRGGELAGPNPTDRGKRGTKYHLAVTGDGVPIAALASLANLHDTVLFSNSCSSMPSPCSPGSRPPSPTRAMIAKRTARSAGPSASSPASAATVRPTEPASAPNAGRPSAAMPGSWKTSVRPGVTIVSAASFNLCLMPPVSSWLSRIGTGILKTTSKPDFIDFTASRAISSGKALDGIS